MTMDELEQLMAKHNARVRNRVLQLVRNRADVDEIVNDVWLSVARNFDAFRHDAEVSSWLYRIATNRALSFLRTRAHKNARRSTSFDVQLHDVASYATQHDDIEQREQVALVWTLLVLLPRVQFDAVVRIYLDGLTYEQAARELRVPLNTVKSRAHRALKQLRERAA